MFYMLILLVAIITTFICFLSIIASVRFLFTKQGLFWLIPLVLSVTFLIMSISPLVLVATQMIDGSYQVSISPDRSVREVVPLIIVLLWYTMILSFRYALKLVIPDNTYFENKKKNLDEAQYIQKKERQKYLIEQMKRNKKKIDISREVAGTTYPIKWVTLYDEH